MRASAAIAGLFCGVLIGTGSIVNAHATSTALRLQYFETWTSYDIPVRPSHPIRYADTEKLDSFYLATFDGKGKLRKFVKYWKQIKVMPDAKLPDVSAASGTLYYSARAAADGTVVWDLPIPYAQTEHLQLYFRLSPEQGSTSVQVALVRIVALVVDEYEYNPNGSLQSRRLTKENGVVQVFHYDASGNELR